MNWPSGIYLGFSIVRVVIFPLLIFQFWLTYLCCEQRKKNEYFKKYYDGKSRWIFLNNNNNQKSSVITLQEEKKNSVLWNWQCYKPEKFTKMGLGLQVIRSALGFFSSLAPVSPLEIFNISFFRVYEAHTVNGNCQFHENRVFDLIFHLEEIEILNRQANASKFLYRKETTKHPIPSTSYTLLYPHCG